MKTYAEIWIHCPHCGINMIHFKESKDGIQYIQCDFKDCIGYGRQYEAPMLEIELTEMHNK